jgi:MFS family permease
MGSVLARRDLRIIIGAEAVSMFGDQALWLAMGIWAKQLTGSNAAAGIVFFFFGVPTLLSPLSGMLVDRVRRRPLMIICELSLAAAVLLLLLVHSRDQLWIIYIVIFGYGLAGTVTASARSALLRTMVPDDDQLASVNGLLQTVREGMRLIAPVAGAGLFAWLGGGAVAILDAATFIVVATGFLFVRVVEPKPQRTDAHWRAEITAGVAHLWRTLPLRQITVATGIALLVVGFTETLVFAVVDQGLHRSASFVGVLEAAMGVGAIAGGLTAGKAVQRYGETLVAAGGLVLFAAGSALLTAPLVGVVLPGMAILGAGVPWLIVGLFTCLQRLTPNELQGRTFSAVDVLISTPQTVSIGVGAGLIAVVDFRLMLAIMVAVVLASGVWLASRGRAARSGPAPQPVDTELAEPLATSSGEG